MGVTNYLQVLGWSSKKGYVSSQEGKLNHWKDPKNLEEGLTWPTNITWDFFDPLGIGVHPWKSGWTENWLAMELIYPPETNIAPENGWLEY